MKLISCFALAAGLALTLAACGGTAAPAATAAPTASPASSAVQLANPWSDADTLEEAAALTGFSLTWPEELAALPGQRFRTMAGDAPILEVTFLQQDSTEAACLRKAPGSADISGDYNAYAETRTLTPDGLTVQAKGEDGLLRLATWTNGGYAYALSLTDAVAEEALSALISSIA